MGILTIILTDGPYISGYAEMAYKMASAAQKMHKVNIFLYLDAVHIPKIGQNPAFFANAGKQVPGACRARSSDRSLSQVCHGTRL